MKIIFRILLLVLFIALAGKADAQLFKRQKASNNDSLRNGKYSEYWDKDSSRISARGYFKNGRPAKTWKYFHADGTRRMKVKYRDKLKIKYYSRNGTLEQKGYAVLDFNAEDIHFYWDGIWKYYDPKRKLYRIALYKMGEETAVIFGPEDPLYFEE